MTINPIKCMILTGALILLVLQSAAAQNAPATSDQPTTTAPVVKPEAKGGAVSKPGSKTLEVLRDLYSGFNSMLGMGKSMNSQPAAAPPAIETGAPPIIESRPGGCPEGPPCPSTTEHHPGGCPEGPPCPPKTE